MLYSADHFLGLSLSGAHAGVRLPGGGASVQLWWRERDPQKAISSDTGAYCRARLRLPFVWLEQLQQALVSRLTERVAAWQLWCERRVKIIDGTTVSMPDSEANQEFWPQQKAQKPGCGFPLMRVVGLFCLSSGALLKTARGTMYQAEPRLARALWSSLDKGDLLLSDRGFCSYAIIARMLEKGVDCVMRLHQRRKLSARGARWLGPGDRIVSWKRPPRSFAGLEGEKADFRTLACELKVRIIRWRIEVRGFRTREVILVTTLLDAETYPTAALQDLYLQRWGVKLHLHEVKTLLGMEVLRCKNPTIVEREILLHQIAYNLVRCVMQQAAEKNHVELRSISFNGPLDTIRAWAQAFHHARIDLIWAGNSIRRCLPLSPRISCMATGAQRTTWAEATSKIVPPLIKPKHLMRVPHHPRQRQPVIAYVSDMENHSISHDAFPSVHE